MPATNQPRIGGLHLAAALPGAQAVGSRQVRVTGCTCDPRKVRPGDAFIAIDGPQGDDCRGVQLAAKRGAAAVVAERLLPIGATPQFLVEDARHAFGALCHALVGHPTASMPTIAVTGSLGKSAVAALASSIISHAGAQPSLSLGADTCLGSAAAAARWLADTMVSGATHAVVEASGTQLAAGALLGASLDAVCVTNLKADRGHGGQSPDAQRRQMLASLELLAPEGIAVLNADDPDCVRALAERDGPTVTFGVSPGADVSATLVERNASEQVFILHSGADSAAVRTEVIGDAHMQNCLAAAAIGLAYGADLTSIAAGIEAVRKLPNTMRPIRSGQGFPVFLDGARSPAALRGVLETAREVASGRVLCVASLNGETSLESSTVAAALSDQTYLIADNGPPRPGAPGRWFDDRFTALALALAVAEPGDCLVLAGHRADSRIEGLTEHEVVTTLLRQRGAQELQAARAA
ncbi:MurE-like ligase [Pirellulimonas nuda]|uniref:MurE-like ligase n=1 Tax=Pirellulimonas nuda TaxID=2528009 RepID=A0A518DFF4_9BACT|nr:Mur ligase family protein [Pirellulimonas nuda]QDU90213.1 MurE-like ligase [Pirellulimonas nuda]